MHKYMQAMSEVITGANPGALTHAEIDSFDPKFANVYRNNSASAFGDVLKANYPSILALVGADFFAHLSRAYMDNYPTNQRTLIGYGARFDQIITDYETEHKLPYLTSFAILDRAWTYAHIAEDTQALEMESLAQVLAQNGDLEAQHLTLSPHAQLIRNHWPVFHIWTKLREGHELGETIQMQEKLEHILVWRFEHEVMYRQLDQAEFTFLNDMNIGKTLGQATEDALHIQPDTNISELLAGMMSAQLFTAITGDRND